MASRQELVIELQNWTFKKPWVFPPMITQESRLLMIVFCPIYLYMSIERKRLVDSPSDHTRLFVILLLATSIIILATIRNTRKSAWIRRAQTLDSAWLALLILKLEERQPARRHMEAVVEDGRGALQEVLEIGREILRFVA